MNINLDVSECSILRKVIDNRQFKLCKSNPFNALDSMTEEQVSEEKAILSALMTKLDPHTEAKKALNEDRFDIHLSNNFNYIAGLIGDKPSDKLLAAIGQQLPNDGDALTAKFDFVLADGWLSLEGMRAASQAGKENIFGEAVSLSEANEKAQDYNLAQVQLKKLALALPI
ncbi:MAG: hypothetical protein JKY96_04975, partial [Phycisphaerales bacterium]|nr:hypothetical protein [Phycisphaerales bacterium]